MFRLFYQALLGFALVLYAPILLVFRGRHYLPTFPGRLTFDLPPAHDGPRRKKSPLWIHAVSVGETGVAATLAKGLPQDLPLLVTTVTPTGQAHAKRLFAARIESGQARVAYLPFDFGVLIHRFFDHFDPAALILVEGDYWPICLLEARRREIPVAVVNGRLSERSARRLNRLPKTLQRLYFDTVRYFGVQTDEDRERLLALGVDAQRVTRTGNLKYETSEPSSSPGLEEALLRRADDRPILLAGSTMQGEDALVLDAFEEIGGERAMLLLVPRHPERWDEAANLVRERGLNLVRRSSIEDDDTERPDVVLLDSLGELAALYRLATGAFIGGTLVPTGGHNPLEAAVFATPVVVGPSMHNFAEMAERFQQADAWRQVPDVAGLAATWSRWLDDPSEARAVGDRGAELLKLGRGALGATLEMLRPILALW